MKPLASRKKEELAEIFEKMSVPLPDPDSKGQITKSRLLAQLAEFGIDNKKILAFEKKEEADAVKATNTYDGMVVVCMDRQNASFKFEHYTFTRDKKYVLMPTEMADRLLHEVPGFRVASPQEIEGYYR